MFRNQILRKCSKIKFHNFSYMQSSLDDEGRFIEHLKKGKIRTQQPSNSQNSTETHKNLVKVKAHNSFTCIANLSNINFGSLKFWLRQVFQTM